MIYPMGNLHYSIFFNTPAEYVSLREVAICDDGSSIPEDPLPHRPSEPFCAGKVCLHDLLTIRVNEVGEPFPPPEPVTKQPQVDVPALNHLDMMPADQLEGVGQILQGPIQPMICDSASDRPADTPSESELVKLATFDVQRRPFIKVMVAGHMGGKDDGTHPPQVHSDLVEECFNPSYNWREGVCQQQ